MTALAMKFKTEYSENDCDIQATLDSIGQSNVEIKETPWENSEGGLMPGFTVNFPDGSEAVILQAIQV